MGAGIKNRYSTLSMQYLNETGNQEVIKAKDNLVCSATDLAVSACQKALDLAEIKAEEVGLILGGNATPVETTPSEAQRVGERLGLKTIAYDLFCDTQNFFLFLDVLSRWDESRIPKYVLCVTSNVPTQRVNYQSRVESYYFGDAAAAMVLSTSVTGKARLLDCYYNTVVKSHSNIKLGIFSHVSLDHEGAKTAIESETMNLIDMAEKRSKIDFKQTKFIGEQLDAEVLNAIARHYGLNEENIWGNLERCAYCLSSSQMCVLAERWESLQAGDKILSVGAGIGSGRGFAFIEV